MDASIAEPASMTEPVAMDVPPGGGAAVWLVGDTYTLKVSGEQTGGAFTLLEALVPPGGGPPPHIHFTEDETFVVLEGELRFTAGERTVPAPVGTIVHVPKGTPHSFATQGDAPARMLFLYTPAGMEGMFAEIGTPAQPDMPAPPPNAEDVARMLAVAEKYHFAILPPPEK